MKTNENQLKSMTINDNQWKLMKIKYNYWKSMTINVNQWQLFRFQLSEWPEHTKKIGPNWYKHYNLIGNYPHEHSRVLFCILKCWTLKPQALVITTILEEYRVCTADGKNRPIEKDNYLSCFPRKLVSW